MPIIDLQRQMKVCYLRIIVSRRKLLAAISSNRISSILRMPAWTTKIFYLGKTGCWTWTFRMNTKMKISFGRTVTKQSLHRQTICETQFLNSKILSSLPTPTRTSCSMGSKIPLRKLMSKAIQKLSRRWIIRHATTTYSSYKTDRSTPFATRSPGSQILIAFLFIYFLPIEPHLCMSRAGDIYVIAWCKRSLGSCED